MREAVRDVVRLCRVHRAVLEELVPEETLWCPVPLDGGHADGHAAEERGPDGSTPRPSWEVWLREDGRPVARLYTVRRGRVQMEEWYEEFSRNYAADLCGRDADGLTPKIRFAPRDAQRELHSRAQARRARLAASVGLSAALLLAVAGSASAYETHNEREPAGAVSVASTDGVEAAPAGDFLDDEPATQDPPEELLVPDKIVFLEDVPPPPAKTRVAKVVKTSEHASPASVTLDLGTQVVVSGNDEGQDETTFLPYGAIEAEAPISIGSDSPWVRGGVDVSLTAAPGQALDVSSIESFRGVEVAFNARRIIGVGRFGLREDGTADQILETSVYCDWAFGFRLDSEDATPESRTTRRYGCGAQVLERNSRALVRLVYGFDGVVGDRGFGHLIVRLRLPVPATGGIIALGVRASLGMGAGPYVPNVRQFDYRAVTVTVDATQAIRSIRGKGKEGR